MLANMKPHVAAVAMLLGIAALSGCSDASPSAAPSPTEAVASNEATPEQVASVLAEYDTDWREVIDGAIDCRFTWTLDDTATGQLEGMACYTREQTMGITSQLVVRDWGEMEIPASMTDLVADTVAMLGLISEVDLAAVCGAEAVPAATQECTDALGSRNFAYSALGGQLDKWKPYL